MPQQDWFTKNAPAQPQPPQSDASGGADWFSANAPSVTPQQIMMTSPSGESAMYPRSQTKDLLSRGYALGQYLPKTAGDKIITGASGQKHIVQGTPNADSGPVENAALNIARKFYPVNRGPLEQAEYELGQLREHPADTLAEAFRDANPIRWFAGSANTEAQRTAEALKRKDYNAAAIHGIDSLVPVVGSQAGDATEQIRSGDVSGGIGSAIGTGLQFGLGNEEITRPIANITKATAGAIFSPRETLKTTIPTAAGKAAGAVRDFAMDPNGTIAAAGQRIFGAKRGTTATPAAEPAVDLGQGEIMPPDNVRRPGDVEPEQVGQQETDENVLAGRQGVRVRPRQQLGTGYVPNFAGQLPERASGTPLPAVSDSAIADLLAGRNIETTRPGADIRAFLRKNPNASPQQIRQQVFSQIDAGNVPDDLGGMAEPFAAKGENTTQGKRIITNKRQPGPPNASVVFGANNLNPTPDMSFGRPMNGHSAAALFLSHQTLPTLEGIAYQREIPFVRGGDMHGSLIGKILDDLSDREVKEFSDASIESSRFPRTVQGPPRPAAGQPQVPTEDNISALLRGSLAQRGVEIPQDLQEPTAAPTSAEQPNAIQQMFSGQPPERRGTGRIDPFSVHGLNISKLRTEMAQATDPADRQAFQDAIDREIALARGENPPLTQQAEAENLPATQPRTVEPSEQWPPKGSGISVASGPGSSPDNPISPHELKPGQAAYVKVDELVPRPKKYQYKGNTDEAGVVAGQITGSKYNHDLANALSYFVDPEDNVASPVNGHNRRNLAVKSGEIGVLARRLDAPDVSTARKIGALQNVSEGRGSALDAANFFREEQITPEELRQRGIAISEGVAQQGLALAKLDPTLFEKVRSGQWTESRGATIGAVTSDPAEQEAVAKLIQKAENRGKDLNNGQVESLARQVANAGKRIEQGQDLFGQFTREHSTAIERAELDDHVQRQIAGDKRTFGAVSSESRASALRQVEGQQIKASENAKISARAAQELELYRKLSDKSGVINDLLENGAKELANGYDKPAAIKAKYAAKIREAIRDILPPSAEGNNPSGSKGASGSGKSSQTKTTSSLRADPYSQDEEDPFRAAMRRRRDESNPFEG